MVDAARVVESDAVSVMFLRTEDNVEDIRRGWARLEQIVPLRARKFYGAFHADSRGYWVCTQLQEGDDPSALGLEQGALPGGRYALARLRGEPPAVYDRIGPTFDALAAAYSVDPGRPSIEFYRSRDQVDLLLPIR